MSELTLHLVGEEAMTSFGARIAQITESIGIIFLEGDLGAGKTTFARGVLRGLGHAGRVKSPTFALVEPYSFSRLNLYHFDFYRFRDPQELAESGLREYFNEAAVCLIEWPEKAAGLPHADLRILIRETNGGRTIDLQAGTENGGLCLQRLEDTNTS